MTAFSIVMPAYNAAPTIEAALRSIEGQTERDYEVIIVDDGSTDGTAELAERLAEGKPYKVLRQPNAGPSAARNRAFEVAEGRWIAQLDADDWFMPTYLARMRELLESGPRVGLVFGDAWVWDEDRRRFARRTATGPYRPRPMPTEQWKQFETLLQINYVYGATCYPLQLALDLGGYDETLWAGEDWQLWLRIVASGWQVIGVEDRLAVYRRRADQASKDIQKMWEGPRLALRALQTATDLPPDMEAALADRIRRHEASKPGQQPNRSAARDLLGRATRWLGPVRDFRLTAPTEVRRALGELR